MLTFMGLTNFSIFEFSKETVASIELQIMFCGYDTAEVIYTEYLTNA